MIAGQHQMWLARWLAQSSMSRHRLSSRSWLTKIPVVLSDAPRVEAIVWHIDRDNWDGTVPSLVSVRPMLDANAENPEQRKLGSEIRFAADYVGRLQRDGRQALRGRGSDSGGAGANMDATPAAGDRTQLLCWTHGARGGTRGLPVRDGLCCSHLPAWRKGARDRLTARRRPPGA